MSIRDYTVIVYPPPPATRNGVSSTPPSGSPRIVKVSRVRSPQEAADRADVQPGGCCVVVVESRRFDRAVRAPLEERDERGQPLPLAASTTETEPT